MARKFRLRGRTRTILMAIAIILVTVTIVGAISVFSGANENFFKPSEWDILTVNEDNHYQRLIASGTDGLVATGEKGVTVKVNDDNLIKVNGMSKELLNITVGTVTLDASTKYVFGSGFDGTGNTMYMQLVPASGTTITCYSEPVTFTTGSDNLTYMVKLVVAADYNVNNKTLKPVICVGETADDLVSFYG